MKRFLYKLLLWVEFLLRRLFFMRDFYVSEDIPDCYVSEEAAIAAGCGEKFGDRMYVLAKEM